LKVRRGKIGGFQGYLPPNDQTCASTVLKALEPRFGYSGASNTISGSDSIG